MEVILITNYPLGSMPDGTDERPMFNIQNVRLRCLPILQNYQRTDAYLTIDETLCATRNQISFKQYNLIKRRRIKSEDISWK